MVDSRLGVGEPQIDRGQGPAGRGGRGGAGRLGAQHRHKQAVLGPHHLVLLTHIRPNNESGRLVLTRTTNASNVNKNPMNKNPTKMN